MQLRDARRVYLWFHLPPPGPDRSMYRQIAVVQHSQKKKNTELWYGRDGQGRPLHVQGEDKG